MTRSIPSAIVALGLSAAISVPALAGEQYVDETGFAVSGYDVVAYFDLDQAAVGQQQPAPVAGSKAFTAEYNGATWAFASAENRDRFAADPAAFAPAYDGHCAYGVAQGGKVPANPSLWRIVDGRLYLNITPQVVEFWNEDISGNIQQSEVNWSDIERDPAATTAVPQFDISAAPHS
ncbi:MAG: YHS domain-containing (seleno)protein [Alphaproteobacteria bacterium]